MVNLVAGFLLSLKIIPGNKSRFEIHPNLIKTLNTKDCAFLTAWLEGWEAQWGRAYCNHFTGCSMQCCAFCCCWRQIGIPDKCENVSKLRREAGKVPEVNLAYLGIITAIVWLSVSLTTLCRISADTLPSLKISIYHGVSTFRDQHLVIILLIPGTFFQTKTPQCVWNKQCWTIDSLIIWQEATRHCETG